MKNSLLTTLLALSLAVPALSKPVVYEFEGGGNVGFEIRQLFGSLKATFTKYNGLVKYDPQKVAASTFDFSFQANSIYTGVEKVDAQLKGPEHFDAATHPKVTFKSKSVKGRGGNNIDVMGTLTVKGISRPVLIPMKVKLGQMLTTPTVEFTGECMVKRSDFGIGKGAKGKQDDIKLIIETEGMGTPPSK